MIYFDSASTTRPLGISLERFVDVEENCFYNTSSSYRAAKESQAILEDARVNIANLLGVDTDKYNIVFTSSASESNAIMLQSTFKKPVSSSVIMSQLEHKSIESFSSILKQKGYTVKILPAKRGYCCTKELGDIIDKDTYLVNVIHTSNVTGSVNDIEGLCRVAKAKNPDVIFNTDITQSVGKKVLDISLLSEAGVDSFSLSSHKCYAPKGLGVLIIKKGLVPSLAPQGGQEWGIRGATHALGLICAFEKSLEYLCKNRLEIDKRIDSISSFFINELEKIDGVYIFREKDKICCSSIVSLAIGNLPSEVSLRLLDDMGFLVGANSACSSNSKSRQDSSFMANLGYSSEYSSGAIRVSFSIYNTKKDAEELLDAIKKIISQYS